MAAKSCWAGRLLMPSSKVIPAAMSAKLTLNSRDIQSSGVLQNLHAWRTRADLTETNERESPTLTLVCISPSSAICMKRNGSVVQRDWLTHKAAETSPLDVGIRVTNTSVRRSPKTLQWQAKSEDYCLSCPDDVTDKWFVLLTYKFCDSLNPHIINAFFLLLRYI